MRTVLHVVPSLSGGGAERQLALLAAEQGRRGWNVHIALRRRGNYASHLEGSGVHIHPLGDLRRGNPLLFVRLHRLIRNLKPDVVQTWLLQMDLVGGAMALGGGVPWVLTERCSQENYDEFPISGWLRHRLGRHADFIVANSQAGARYWRDVLGERARIATIGNAIDVESIERARPITFDIPHLVCAGRLVPQKAHDIVLDAVVRVGKPVEFRLLMLGDGVLRPHLEEQIAKRGLSGRVQLMPYRDGWWSFLRGAAGLVNPSRFEGQPNVVLEAMAAGCPVVVSDIAPHREILDDDSALFVRVNDADALARAITSVLTDRPAASRRASNAARRIAGASVRFTAERYEHLYAQLDHR